MKPFYVPAQLITVDPVLLAQALNVRNERVIRAIKHGLRDVEKGASFAPGCYPVLGKEGGPVAPAACQVGYEVGLRLAQVLLKQPNRSVGTSIVRQHRSES